MITTHTDGLQLMFFFLFEYIRGEHNQQKTALHSKSCIRGVVVHGEIKTPKALIYHFPPPSSFINNITQYIMKSGRHKATVLHLLLCASLVAKLISHPTAIVEYL